MQTTHSSSCPSKCSIMPVPINGLVLRCILDHVKNSRLALSQGSQDSVSRQMKSLKKFLCSSLWLEVHTHYGQSSLLLRHTLSFLGVTKLSQPASPNGFCCLGDPTPSQQAAATLPSTHLHGVSSRLWQPAWAQSHRVSGMNCTCPSLQQRG